MTDFGYSFEIFVCLEKDSLVSVCMYAGRGYSVSDVCMYVCMCVCSNTFSETTGPIEARFHVEPPWNRGRKFILMVQVICCSSLLSTYGGGAGL